MQSQERHRCRGHLVVFPLNDWGPVIPPMAIAVSLGWGRARKGPMWPLRGGNLSWAAGHRVAVGVADPQKVWALGSHSRRSWG